jgi:tRNA pseudouridine65 synthase
MVAVPEIVVLYRDDRYVVVDKPSGLVVHRGWAREPHVVLTVVRDQLGQWVYPVHRLDRGTSGTLVFGLDQEAATALMGAFAEGTVEKTYLALVRNTPPEGGRIDYPVPRSEKGPRVPAVTDYERLQVLDRCSLVRAWPRTGKLHQIRRHLKHLGHPILGDRKYGRGWFLEHFAEHYGLRRLALHAQRLAFDHPFTRARVEVSAPLGDLGPVLERLGARL